MNVDKQTLVTETVTQGQFNDYIRVSGQVEPINTIQLSAIEGGMVSEKLVEEGAEVHQGDVIVKLKNTMLNLNILDSEAQLAEKQNFLRNTLVSMEQERLSLKKERLQLDMFDQQGKGMITESEALKLFGNTNPIGKTVYFHIAKHFYNNQNTDHITIQAVCKDFQKNCSLANGIYTLLPDDQPENYNYNGYFKIEPRHANVRLQSQCLSIRFPRSG